MNSEAVLDRYGFFGRNQPYNNNNNNRDISAIESSRNRLRELKWIEMVKNWNWEKAKNNEKIVSRTRKGIPQAIRPRAWQLLCGGSTLMSQNPGIFENLLSQPGDPIYIENIHRDLYRDILQHEMFKEVSGPGRLALFQVLKAFSIYNTVNGYQQGFAPIAVVLVMHMPAEEAFWCFVAIFKFYLPGYFSDDIAVESCIDWDVLIHLLKKEAPIVHRHMVKKFEYSGFYLKWFTCVYSRTLPWSAVLRVWDIFMCEGLDVLIKVGLVLLKETLSKTITEKTTLGDTVDLIENLPTSVTDENSLVSKMLKLRMSAVVIERARMEVIQLRKIGKTATTHFT